MSSKLDATIAKLTFSFAESILKAIQSASLEQLVGANVRSAAAAAPVKRGPGRPKKAAAPAPAPKPIGKPAKAAKPAKAGKAKLTASGHLARRSADQIDGTIVRIVSALKGKKDGLRSEQLQKVLGLAKNEIVRPISKALEDGKITKKGEKRATTYFAR